MIWITHDLSGVAGLADRIAVMYAGRIVEEGPARVLIREPRHPYTVALLKSRAHGTMAKGGRLATIAGAPPDLSALPAGCAFADRCTLADDRCRAVRPDIVRLAPDHLARCLRTADTALTA
jgi:peptide/nickel transport system ATP-binding protein